MEKKLKGIPVLFENNFCLLLNKPAGLSVQGGEGVKVSLDSLLSEEVSPRPFLVHRLDRDTSGLILVAKTKEAARVFSACFSGDLARRQNNGRITRKYFGVCSGLIKPSQGVIRLKLDVRGKGKTLNNKEAETFYRLLKPASSQLPELMNISFLELELGSGRMHQIRRHLASCGNPLLGDDKYGDFPLNRKLKTDMGLKNLLLHASSLAIPPLPPFLPRGLELSAPLPEYFSKFLQFFSITCY